MSTAASADSPTAAPGAFSSLAEHLFSARISPVAAKALVADFARHPGPKHGLVLGATADSPVLPAAIDALGDRDSLTLVAGAEAEKVRALITAAGDDVRQRVRVTEALSEAEPADAIIVAEVISGGADETRGEVEALAKHLVEGGVISLAVAAAAFLSGGATEELERQACSFGVGSDLVLRNVPPVRVHRLRFTPAPVDLAERLAPLPRTSSVALTPEMHIDSNGIAAAAICLGVAALARAVTRNRGLRTLPVLAALPAAAFFRDPERTIPDDPDAIVAASDGRVLDVQRLRDERIGPEEFVRISVFLSVFDVHINRAPAAGRVVDFFVLGGGYAPAMQAEAEQNVTAYTVLETTHGTVAVAQRTGLIARRIVHRAPVGSLLARGERVGLIRFGSRTDVYLPADSCTPAVAPGDRVLGGESIIARWTD